MKTTQPNYTYIAETVHKILDPVDQTRTNVYVLENTLRVLTRKYGFERGYNLLRSTLNITTKA